MFRQIISLIIFVITVVFLATVLLPVPWFYFSGLVEGYRVSVIVSPFYYSVNGGLSMPVDSLTATVRNLTGILSLVTIGIIAYAFERRRKAFRTGDRIALSSMRFGFGISIFLLILIALLFYDTLPATIDNSGNYREIVLIGFFIIFMLVGASQSLPYPLPGSARR